MPIESVKMKISKNLLMSQGSFNPKIRFLGEKVCSVARGQTDEQTDTEVTTVGTLSGFKDFFLQPITKDRPNNIWDHFINASHAEMQCRRARGGINKSELMLTRYILSYLKICHLGVMPWGDR